MKWAVLVLSAAVTAGALHLDSSDISQEEWNNYKLHHNKQYSSAEEERERMKTYAENKLMVEQHNEQYERGLTTFTLGLNKFSDRFQEELDRMTTYTIGKYKIPNKAAQTSNLINPLKKEVPNKMDWREKSAVTPVQDQGDCATGWAFAATGALEGAFAIKNGYLISLSAQNLIECCGSNGSKLGNATQAWDYVHYHGIETEKDYPNKKEVGKCGFKSKKSVMKVDAHLWVDCSNGTALKQAVAVRGPIAAPIAASDAKFRAYQGGVYSVKKCSLKHNHYVLVVGYGSEKMQIGGEEKNVDYWLVKNSWGTGWGIGGYMKLARNGLCGLGEYPLVF